MPWMISETEDDALQGLPHISQIIYMRVLRRHMDYETGIAGSKHRISRQGLSETVYVEPVRGRTNRGAISHSAIKNAITILKNAGLIEQVPDANYMIFLLPLALMDRSVQKQYVRAKPSKASGFTSGQSPIESATNDTSTSGFTALIKDAMRPSSGSKKESIEKKEKKYIKKRKKTGSEYSSEFEIAWHAYPRRPGNNKKSAYRMWCARLNDAVIPEIMHDGVTRYARYIEATGNTGTNFVKLAATFFGPDCHFESEWEIPAQPTGGTHGDRNRQPTGADIHAEALKELAGATISEQAIPHYGGNAVQPPRGDLSTEMVKSVQKRRLLQNGDK